MSPSKCLVGPVMTLAASTRSSFNAEMQRAKTDSAISVSGTPKSKATTPVHLPVPFWPAVSRMFSTSGDPSSSL